MCTSHKIFWILFMLWLYFHDWFLKLPEVISKFCDLGGRSYLDQKCSPGLYWPHIGWPPGSKNLRATLLYSSCFSAPLLMVSPIRVVLTQLESLCAWKMKEKESDSAARQSELRLSPLTHFTDIAKVEPSLATPHCTRVHTLIKFQISSLQILSSFKIIWCHIPANFHCSL